MSLLQLDSKIVEDHVLPYLDPDDLLALRAVCSATHGLVDGFKGWASIYEHQFGDWFENVSTLEYINRKCASFQAYTFYPQTPVGPMTEDLAVACRSASVMNVDIRSCAVTDKILAYVSTSGWLFVADIAYRFSPDEAWQKTLYCYPADYVDLYAASSGLVLKSRNGHLAFWKSQENPAQFKNMGMFDAKVGKVIVYGDCVWAASMERIWSIDFSKPKAAHSVWEGVQEEPYDFGVGIAKDFVLIIVHDGDLISLQGHNSSPIDDFAELLEDDEFFEHVTVAECYVAAATSNGRVIEGRFSEEMTWHDVQVVDVEDVVKIEAVYVPDSAPSLIQGAIVTAFKSDGSRKHWVRSVYNAVDEVPLPGEVAYKVGCANYTLCRLEGYLDFKKRV